MRKIIDLFQTVYLQGDLIDPILGQDLSGQTQEFGQLGSHEPGRKVRPSVRRVRHDEINALALVIGLRVYLCPEGKDGIARMRMAPKMEHAQR